MTKEEILNKLKEQCSHEKMKQWEIKCKNEIVDYFTIKTKRPREEVINAIKNTKETWLRLHQVVDDKNCGHEYGFFECPCEGDFSQCPHSHAHLDIVWDTNKNRKIESFRIGARPCGKYQEAIKERVKQQNDREQQVRSFY